MSTKSTKSTKTLFDEPLDPRCSALQERLAEHGPTTLQDDAEDRDHVAECDNCFALLEDLATLDGAFSELTTLPTPDAPQALVDTVLETVRQTPHDATDGTSLRVTSDRFSSSSEATPAKTRFWPAALRRLRGRRSKKSGTSESPSSRRSTRRWFGVAALLASGIIAWGILMPRLGLRRGDAEHQKVYVLVEPEAASPAPLPVTAPARQVAGGGLASGDLTGGNLPGDTADSNVAVPDIAASDLASDLRVAQDARLQMHQEPLESYKERLREQLDGIRALGEAKGEARRRPISDGKPKAKAEPPTEAGGNRPSPTPDVDLAELDRDDQLRRTLPLGEGRISKRDAYEPSPPPGVGGRAGADRESGKDELVEETLSSVTAPSEVGSEERRNLDTGSFTAAISEESTLEPLQDLPFAEDGPQILDKVLELEQQKDALPHTDNEALRLAKGWLDARQRIEGVPVRQAAGYWANTYVPGDPLFRLLHTRLLGADAPPWASDAPHEASRLPLRPFDPPTRSALAVSLRADHGQIAGPARTLLQVGIRATDRRGGRRPALDLALVLDLRGEISPEQATALRALAGALNERRDPGDRFRLVIAGRPGAPIIEPADFRHGPLTLALDQALGLGGGGAAVLDLPRAMGEAYKHLTAGEAPGATLGTSLVLLATGQPLGDAVASLEPIVHRAATRGITTSVVGVGGAIDRGELDRLALTGQGNQRLLVSATDATALVDRELEAVSRVVARALRLRIRLAPGVELVDVLGSERLDAARAEAVRQAEQSVDLRLARDFGITADRGEDEEGIQIVIPAFYSGDSHVILLDVIAPGPGPLADVTLRYKDLVHLRNGLTRDQLTLGRGEPSRGPLELDVVENLLAYRLFERLEAAGLSLARGDGEGARTTLEQALALRRGLRQELPSLAGSTDLSGDIALLDRYLALLSGDPESVEAPRLSDSLRLAARLRILPRPTIDR